jgi:pyruvate kinase
MERHGTVAVLEQELGGVREALVAAEHEAQALIAETTPSWRDGARNLVDYVALRRHDLRELQGRLAALGLSSLGRAEAHVMPTLDAVLGALRALRGHGGLPADASDALAASDRLLAQHTRELLGAPREGRAVRVMVTASSEVATRRQLVQDLMVAGMDVLRINSAHDDEAVWRKMIANVREAGREIERACVVQVDLSGPKLRTGAFESAPGIVHWKPKRDARGDVTAPARVWLTPSESPAPAPPGADAAVPIAGSWLAHVDADDQIEFCDRRGKRRVLSIVAVDGESRWAEAFESAYVEEGTVFRTARTAGGGRVGPLSMVEAPILLSAGDTAVLVKDDRQGRGALRGSGGVLLSPAVIPCTLPEVFASARPGHRIWFDDGRIGGVILSCESDQLRVRIDQAGPEGSKLSADKGINLPDTPLALPALSEADRSALAVAAECADVVGLSFARRVSDVEALQDALRTVDRRIGVILKIETREGFENLPGMLVRAMRTPPLGVMIARGDLAVECGYERLAELQEELLCVCEAAHAPVVWATQVLESLAKSGQPSRAEISDAAMSVRAECVMLNKGPHILHAVRTLDDILKRMEGHQRKRTPMLRALQSLHSPA